MSFSIDHIIPRSADRGGPSERDYGNLVYACNRCNSIRVVADVLNPTQCSLGEHLEVLQDDGLVMGRTDEGRRTIWLLELNDPILCDHRRRLLALLDLKRKRPDDPEIHNLFLRVFGYPDDLPDLRRLRPPLGNTKPGSEEDCYFALRERGELAQVY